MMKLNSGSLRKKKSGIFHRHHTGVHPLLCSLCHDGQYSMYRFYSSIQSYFSYNQKLFQPVFRNNPHCCKHCHFSHQNGLRLISQCHARLPLIQYCTLNFTFLFCNYSVKLVYEKDGFHDMMSPSFLSK